jgi:DNA invertase Pin-like site-specific DNA recombinase
MKAPSIKPVRCAIYTRVSTEHGLDQEFNSLDAQYEAASAYIKSQAHAGWTLIRSRYDDGGIWKCTATRNNLVALLRVVIGTGVITGRTIDCWHNNKRAHSQLNSREAPNR